MQGEYPYLWTQMWDTFTPIIHSTGQRYSKLTMSSKIIGTYLPLIKQSLKIIGLGVHPDFTLYISVTSV